MGDGGAHVDFHLELAPVPHNKTQYFICMKELVIQKDISLAKYTTFALGGNARFFIEARSYEDLACAYAFAKENKLPVFLLGGGSNILVGAEGYNGVVIKVSLLGIEEKTSGRANDILLEVGAGVSWDSLVLYTTQKGWWGFENLSAIPGSVGATPVQNIGAYGKEIAEHIVWVEVFDPQTNTLKKISKEECAFGYRASAFQKQYREYCITRVCYRLSRSGAPVLSYKDFQEYALSENVSPQEIRKVVCAIRAKKFPSLKEYGTAGSFFINPTISNEEYRALQAIYPDIPGFETKEGIKIPLAWILDSVLALRGHKQGNARVYEKHALVLVSERFACAHDVRTLAKNISARVYEKTHIRNFP